MPEEKTALAYDRRAVPTRMRTDLPLVVGARHIESLRHAAEVVSRAPTLARLVRV